jgi:hypothetical protein
MPLILRERIDRHQRLECRRQLPVLAKLDGVKTRPLPYQPQRSRWQRPVEDRERSELDLGDVLSVMRVKCGGGWSGRYM